MLKQNWFDRANDAIRNTEASVVNFLSAIAPWGAPLAPASMAYIGMTTHLEFHHVIAGILAFVIEILGLATVHTTITFWQFNRRRLAEYKRRPTELAAGMFGFYLLIILTTNVILEIPIAYPETPAYIAAGIPMIAKLLLSLLAVPAAVTMAIRANHTMMLHDAHPKVTAKDPKDERNFAKDWRKLPDEDKRIIAGMSTPDIINAYNVSERTAQNWRKAAKNGVGK